jgi:hypothetical protein
MGAFAAMAAAKIIADMANSDRPLGTTDLSALYSQIDQSEEYQQYLIDQLPEELKKGYATYQDSLGKAGQNLQATNEGIGQKLLEGTKSLYGPNSDTVQATLAGLKTQDYSTLPGTLTNLKAQLAATGGLDRGGASKAIAQAVQAPASTYAQQAQTVMSQQLQAQQENTQAALNKVAAIDEATAQQLFGMSKQEATTILEYGRSDLKDQLTSLINANTNTTNAKLGLAGYSANQAYQNATTRNSQLAQTTNDIAGGIGGLLSGLTASGTTDSSGSGVPADADVGSSSYYKNALANAPK